MTQQLWSDPQKWKSKHCLSLASCSRMHTGLSYLPYRNHFLSVKNDISFQQDEEVLTVIKRYVFSNPFQRSFALCFLELWTSILQHAFLWSDVINKSVKGMTGVLCQSVHHIYWSITKLRFWSLLFSNNRKKNVTNVFWRHSRKYSVTGE